jgi:hypothetical protein
MQLLKDLDELEKIKNNLKKININIINTHVKDILEKISKDYSIPLETLIKKYYIDTNSKRDLKKELEDLIEQPLKKCNAKTNRGCQCSRLCKDNEKYCKKHLEIRKYGDFN